MTTENPIQPQTKPEPQAPALRSSDLFGFWEWLKAKHPDLISDNSIGTLQESFLAGVKWEQEGPARRFKGSLSVGQKARIASGGDYLPSYMLNADGTIKEGEWI